MPELGPYGSVRGAVGNSRPYRDCRPVMAVPRTAVAGVRKPPREETAVGERMVVQRALWGFERGVWGFGARTTRLIATVVGVGGYQWRLVEVRGASIGEDRQGD
jgi:hypothetical protein